MPKTEVSTRRPLALVTGGAGGIGRALAQQFAQHGYNLIVVDRLENELRAVSEALEREYPSARCQALAMDLAEPGAAEALFARCESEGHVVDVLINNVGFGKLGEHVEQSPAVMREMLSLNNGLLTTLCLLFGRQMKQRRAGRILNVASLVGFSSSPYFSAYSGTKAYVIAFSVGLARELGEYGVTVSCLCPGTTKTGFLDAAQSEHASSQGILRFVSAFVASPETVARAGFKGAIRGKLIIVPTFFLKAQAAVLKLLPIEFVSGFVHRKIRYADAR